MGVGRALKSCKLMLYFIGPYQISEKVGEMAYQIDFPPSLANLHDVFHVSQLRKYILDPSHVIQMDDVHIRDNLIVEASIMLIQGRGVKQLLGKYITLVKVLWDGPAGGSLTWEHEDEMKESCPTLFSSGNFRGENSLSGGEL